MPYYNIFSHSFGPYENMVENLRTKDEKQNIFTLIIGSENLQN